MPSTRLSARRVELLPFYNRGAFQTTEDLRNPNAWQMYARHLAMTDTIWHLGSVKTRNSEAGGRLDYPSDSRGETLALKVKHNLSDDLPHASHGQILDECNGDVSTAIDGSLGVSHEFAGSEGPGRL
jgi:hypothetical protein